MSKFTEGPWEVMIDEKPLGAVSVHGDGKALLELWLRGKRETEMANARLISQAPAMHKELEKVLTGLIDYPAIQKIVDKVEGEV